MSGSTVISLPRAVTTRSTLDTDAHTAALATNRTTM
jgi:hypothetical protein